MGRKIDHTGQVFGRLTVIGPAGKDNRGELKWLCQCSCGNQKVAFGYNLRHHKTTSCGCYRTEISTRRITHWSKESIGKYRGPNARNWKGGRKTNASGYVHILVGPGNKYRLEHHVVMEQMIGRSLLPKETVHHINGIKDDNSLVNLELWSSSHPSG